MENSLFLCTPTHVLQTGCQGWVINMQGDRIHDLKNRFPLTWHAKHCEMQDSRLPLIFPPLCTFLFHFNEAPILTQTKASSQLGGVASVTNSQHVPSKSIEWSVKSILCIQTCLHNCMYILTHIYNTNIKLLGWNKSYQASNVRGLQCKEQLDKYTMLPPLSAFLLHRRSENCLVCCSHPLTCLAAESKQTL